MNYRASFKYFVIMMASWCIPIEVNRLFVDSSGAFTSPLNILCWVICIPFSIWSGLKLYRIICHRYDSEKA